jgi:predicted enzyme related to lactoylglutathione lyase
MSGIAKLWKPVVNVTDLDVGERFWSAVSGLSPMGRHGQFSVLDSPDADDRAGWMLLQLVPSRDDCMHGGTHLDFRVDDVTAAVVRIEQVGGTVVRAPEIYRPDGEDMLEWAVMLDPFGNQFCVIRWPLATAGDEPSPASALGVPDSHEAEGET